MRKSRSGRALRHDRTVGHYDPARADASAWIEALPVIQQFRARVLRKRGVRKGAWPR